MAQVVGESSRKWSIAEFDQLFDSVKNWGHWGADDTKGTLNYITPEHVRRAASLVRSGRSISMSLPVNKVAGPDNPNPAIHYMATGHDNDIGSGSLRFATDFLGMQFHGDCHTHIDALCHIAYRGQLYNGRPAGLVTTSGADAFDITEYAQGVVGRGVLLDIPRLRGVPWLEPGTAVSRAELERGRTGTGSPPRGGRPVRVPDRPPPTPRPARTVGQRLHRRGEGRPARRRHLVVARAARGGLSSRRGR